MSDEEKKEMERCESSPYYFCTKYLYVGTGEEKKLFTTHLSEKDFNEQVKQLNFKLIRKE